MSKEKSNIDVKRDFHPAAAFVPLMDKKSLAQLAESIKRNGQRVAALRDPVTGQIFDGRNRALACELAGVELLVKDIEPGDEDTITELCRDLNVERRHLDRKAIKAAVVAALKARPVLSDRKIAEKTGARRGTVGTIRKDLESTGTIVPVGDREGADGKIRKPKAVSRVGIIDSRGRAVPENLRAVFADRWIAEGIAELDSLIRKAEIVCQSIGEAVAAKGGGNPWLAVRDVDDSMPEAIDYWKLVKETLQNANPATGRICEDCAGAAGGCAKCRKSGWVPFSELMRRKQAG